MVRVVLLGRGVEVVLRVIVWCLSLWIVRVPVVVGVVVLAVRVRIL